MLQRVLLLFLVLLLGAPARAGGPPVFAGAFPDHRVEVARAVRHRVPRALDASGGGASVSVSGLPKGLLFDPGKSVIYGATAKTGSYPVVVKATDRSGQTTKLTSTYQVKAPVQSLTALVGRLASNATIDAPLPPVTVSTGTIIDFSGSADGGINPSWNMGNGSILPGYTVSYAFPEAGTYTVTFSIAGNAEYFSSSASVQVNVEGLTMAPVISAFSATPTTINAGSSSTLSWTVGGATSLRIDPGIGTVTGTSQVVTPAATTTYTLTATNFGGSATRTSMVTVNPGVAISITEGSTASADPGQGIVLHATVTGTTNPGVIWSGPTGIGSFSGSTDNPVVWTAPSNIGGTFTLTVAAAARTSVTASIDVTVPVKVTASPATDSGPAGQARSFTATVLGSSNTGVNWTASGGSPVSGSGASFTWTPPASAAAGTVFTLTAASAADPSRTATVSFTVSSSITAVTVAPATVSLGTGGAQAFTATVTGTGSFSPALSWTVVEAGGGSVNGSGAYTAPSTPGTYHVKATSTQDPLQSGQGTVTVSASVPKPAISYPLPGNRVFAVGTAIAAWTPTNSGGAASTWSVAPALPAGLVFNTGNGVITGTPTATSALSTYTVTATNAGGAGTTTLSITVNPALTAPIISYPTPNQTFSVGTAIPAWTPANSGGAASSWSINPALPAGLVLSASTGVISGTPTVLSPASTYTVTATNAAGPGTTTISITVVVALPIPSYTPNAQVYLVGTAIATWAPSNGGGAATDWAINPALPAGLSFNVTNGLITGTPTVASPATTYTVTASNATGGGQTPITVTVNQPGLGPMTWKRDIAYLGGRQVAEIDKTGAIRVTLTDHLGSPRLLVDPTGTVSEQKYMPFGESLTNTATMAKSAKGFTGHEQTDASGLIYMQARFYAPMYHRFLSPDPGRDQHFENTQSWNIYSYVRNSPILSTDPTGMEETKKTDFEKFYEQASAEWESLRAGNKSSGSDSWDQSSGPTKSENGSSDLPAVPASITQPSDGNPLPLPGQVAADNSIVETPGGGEKTRKQPRTNGKEIIIDLEAQNLSAYDKKKLIYSFDVISGNKDNPTPTGRFKITRKVTPYRSKKYDAPMNYAMFFNGGNAIHQFHGPFGLDRFAKSISDWFGSHGCVRLSEENARTLYQWTPVGTIVEVFQ